MKYKTEHENAGPRRRVGADQSCRSTRRGFLQAMASWPALAWTNVVFGQSQKAPVLIGYLITASREESGQRFAAFKQGLAALGWKEGVDYRLEERWTDGRVERLQALAEDLAARKPTLIVAAASQAVRAAAKAAPNTPIVQANGDPLATGLVTSLARPGGMITGLSNVNADAFEKFVELLLVAAPKIRRIGFLVDPTSLVYGDTMAAARLAVERHRVEARFAEAPRLEEIEPALSRLAKEGAQALILMPSNWFPAERQRIVKLALAYRWPMVAGPSENAEAGALISYGVDRSALFRRAAFYVDRILKGAKPGDLPIEQPTVFELVVNARTAKALGLTIPSELRLRATRVIE